MKKMVLGRGLDSLLPRSNKPEEVASNIKQVTSTDYVVISVDSIFPNPYQPRKQFDDNALRNLAESLKTEGMIQPIIVKPTINGRYQLIAGERRWQAAQLAGLKEIPAIISRKGSGRDEFLAALLENLQREDLNPLEEAEAFQRLSQEFELSHEEIAHRVGRSRAAVSNALRLLGLPPAIQEALRQKRVTTGQVRPLLTLPEDEALALFARIEAGGLSSRDAENLAATKGKRRNASDHKVSKPGAIALADAEDRLVKVWGRSVKIVGTDHVGHVRIDYYSKTDAIDLVERLLASR